MVRATTLVLPQLPFPGAKLCPLLAVLHARIWRRSPGEAPLAATVYDGPQAVGSGRIGWRNADCLGFGTHIGRRRGGQSFAAIDRFQGGPGRRPGQRRPIRRSSVNSSTPSTTFTPRHTAGGERSSDRKATTADRPKPNPQTAKQKSVKDETTALAHDTLPSTNSQETKASPSRAHGRAGGPDAPSLVRSRQTSDRPAFECPSLGAGRSAGLLVWRRRAPADRSRSKWPNNQAHARRAARRCRSRASRLARPAESVGRQSMASKTAGAATKWMSKVVSPLFGRDEPAERQASASATPSRAQTNSRQYPAVNQPLAHADGRSPALNRRLPQAFSLSPPNDHPMEPGEPAARAKPDHAKPSHAG